MIVYNNIMLRQFPKFEKYLLANKIRELGYEILSLVITINKKFHKKTTLTELNIKHEILRQLINLSAELRYIDVTKHRVSLTHVDEVGKMIGGWIKRELFSNTEKKEETKQEAVKQEERRGNA